MRFRALIFKHVAAGNARRGNGPRDREPQAGCGRQPPASHACRPRAPGTSPAALCRRTPGLRNAPASRWSLPPPPDVFNRSRIRCGVPPKGLLPASSLISLSTCTDFSATLAAHRFLFLFSLTWPGQQRAVAACLNFKQGRLKEEQLYVY